LDFLDPQIRTSSTEQKKLEIIDVHNNTEFIGHEYLYKSLVEYPLLLMPKLMENL